MDTERDDLWLGYRPGTELQDVRLAAADRLGCDVSQIEVLVTGGMILARKERPKNERHTNTDADARVADGGICGGDADSGCDTGGMNGHRLHSASDC